MPTCKYPRLAASTGYARGCRCIKCITNLSNTRESSKRYYRRNRAKLRAFMNSRTTDERYWPNVTGRARVYGIPTSDYLLLRTVKATCLICGTQLGSTNRVIDHNHNSGIIRGLLCQNCNKGLGHFKDSPSLLCNGVLYLYATQNKEAHYKPKFAVKAQAPDTGEPPSQTTSQGTGGGASLSVGQTTHDEGVTQPK